MISSMKSRKIVYHSTLLIFGPKNNIVIQSLIESTNYVTMKMNEIEMNNVHISLSSSKLHTTLLVIYDI